MSGLANQKLKTRDSRDFFARGGGPLPVLEPGRQHRYRALG